MNENKREMRSKAQMIRGLTNVLKKDADYICVDTDDHDLIGLGESLREIKETIQSLIDNVEDLEYLVYSLKRYI